MHPDELPQTRETWDLGEGPGGRSLVHFEGDEVITEKRFDAEPLLDHAAAMRSATAGQRWGNLRNVGTIPAAIWGQMMRDGRAFDQKAVARWLQENPHFVTFDPFLRRPLR